MAVIIKHRELDVDIAEELEPYLERFPKYRVRGIKLQSCSPFRDEAKPSFAVNLEDGTWIDSGAYDDHWKQGNLPKLLAFFMGVTYEEAESYLLEKYATILDDVDNYTLDVNLLKNTAPEAHTFPLSTLEPYSYRNPYLGNRGISEKVQRAFKIGYDMEGKAITLPWMNKNGELINVKFRSILDKRFYYLKGGQPIKQHIYGLHFIHKMNIKKAYVVESETDCLYLWTHGIPAIALGSASLSKKQEELILSSPIEHLVLAFDNDTAGYRCRDNVVSRLLGVLKLSKLLIPGNCKDVNDVTDLTALTNLIDICPTFTI